MGCTLYMEYLIEKIKEKYKNKNLEVVTVTYPTDDFIDGLEIKYEIYLIEKEKIRELPEEIEMKYKKGIYSLNLLKCSDIKYAKEERCLNLYRNDFINFYPNQKTDAYRNEIEKNSFIKFTNSYVDNNKYDSMKMIPYACPGFLPADYMVFDTRRDKDIFGFFMKNEKELREFRSFIKKELRELREKYDEEIKNKREKLLRASKLIENSGYFYEQQEKELLIDACKFYYNNLSVDPDNTFPIKEYTRRRVDSKK